MKCMILRLTLFATIAACSGSPKPTTTPTTDPVPMTEPTPTPTVVVTEPVKAAEPPAPDPAKIKADLIAVETAAYDKAKPVFQKFCASCHTKGGKDTAKAKLDHFDMTTYPFGGHHAMELGKSIRKVLAIGGDGKATMPKGKPGTVKGDDLALVSAWADAFDASHVGGAHEDHANHDAGHKH